MSIKFLYEIKREEPEFIEEGTVLISLEIMRNKFDLHIFDNLKNKSAGERLAERNPI